jgi:hypothetical protein
MKTSLPKLPQSWSELSWQQLHDCWQVKQRYGGNADVARVAAMLVLLGCEVCLGATVFSPRTGETLYRLKDKDGIFWIVTAREAAQMAKATLPWFDYPYGDPGEPAVKDDKDRIVKEAREAVRGYVSPMRDALILPKDTLKVGRKVFALPQVACNNLTWQQYRSLQAIAPQLFSEGVDDSQAAGLQAQFLAHCLVPRSLDLLDTTGGTIRFRPHYEFCYNTSQAEGLVPWWRKRMAREQGLFHICFQSYQTALTYYAATYPLLFSGEEKKDAMRDALSGEVGTINTIMKYAGYAEQQQVYDSNLPFVLDILNTMTKEAKEIERMNAKIKKK